jgi:hypothetical protein
MIRTKMQRWRGWCHLPHGTVAKISAVYLRGREQEWYCARGQQMRHPDIRPHGNPLRSLPELEGRSAHAKRHRHSSLVTRCGDRESVQRAAFDALGNGWKVNDPSEQRRER